MSEARISTKDRKQLDQHEAFALCSLLTMAFALTYEPVTKGPEDETWHDRYDKDIRSLEHIFMFMGMPTQTWQSLAHLPKDIGLNRNKIFSRNVASLASVLCYEDEPPSSGANSGGPSTPSHSQASLDAGELRPSFGSGHGEARPPPPSPASAASLEKWQSLIVERLLKAMVYGSGALSYDARSRLSVKTICRWLRIPERILFEQEYSLARDLVESVADQDAHNHAPDHPDSPSSRMFFGLKVGAAALGGGALLALTGGLAAPAIAAGLGALLTTAGLTAAAGAVAGSAVIMTASSAVGFGLWGANEVALKMARRIGGVTDIQLKEVPEEREAPVELPASSMGFFGFGGASRESSGSDLNSPDGSNPKPKNRRSRNAAAQLQEDPDSLSRKLLNSQHRRIISMPDVCKAATESREGSQHGLAAAGQPNGLAAEHMQPIIPASIVRPRPSGSGRVSIGGTLQPRPLLPPSKSGRASAGGALQGAAQHTRPSAAAERSPVPSGLGLGPQGTGPSPAPVLPATPPLGSSPYRGGGGAPLASAPGIRRVFEPKDRGRFSNGGSAPLERSRSETPMPPEGAPSDDAPAEAISLHPFELPPSTSSTSYVPAYTLTTSTTESTNGMQIQTETTADPSPSRPQRHLSLQGSGPAPPAPPLTAPLLSPHLPVRKKSVRREKMDAAFAAVRRPIASAAGYLEHKTHSLKERTTSFKDRVLGRPSSGSLAKNPEPHASPHLPHQAQRSLGENGNGDGHDGYPGPIVLKGLARELHREDGLGRLRSMREAADASDMASPDRCDVAGGHVAADADPKRVSDLSDFPSPRRSVAAKPGLPLEDERPTNLMNYSYSGASGALSAPAASFRRPPSIDIDLPPLPPAAPAAQSDELDSADVQESGASDKLDKKEKSSVPAFTRTMTLAEKQRKRLALTICISGWVWDPKQFYQPWQGLMTSRPCQGGQELVAMVWEEEHVIALGNTLLEFVKGRIYNEIVSWVASELLDALWSAVALPMKLISWTNVIDNAWAIVERRSEHAGQVLARVINSGVLGQRPVTLVGYSFGASVVFFCLLELDKLGDLGRIENAFLLGAPLPTDVESWTRARRAVAGRLVNGYSANDVVLGVVHRVKSLAFTAAGIQPVGVVGVEDINLSRVVSGHTDYATKMDDIIEAIGM